MGKANQCSITEFFGGRKQESIACYGSAGMYQSAEVMPRKLLLCELGFEAYKFRPALGPAEDLRTVELMRGSLAQMSVFAWMPMHGGEWEMLLILRRLLSFLQRRFPCMISHGWKSRCLLKIGKLTPS